jgi:hypothetical protein
VESEKVDKEKPVEEEEGKEEETTPLPPSIVDPLEEEEEEVPTLELETKKLVENLVMQEDDAE